jgi:hypothetical protein
MKKLKCEKELTKKQAEYLKAFEWLVGGGHKQEGRTRLLAVAYIKAAINNPGVWIMPTDHVQNYSSFLNLVNEISHLLEKESFEGLSYDCDSCGRFRIKNVSL